MAVHELKPGVHVFDLGANVAGWARLETHGKRGQKITLQFNELLNKDGTVNVAQNAGLTGGRFQTEEFILKGEGLEDFEPWFTYHGFRYVQVTGLSEKPTLASLTGKSGPYRPRAGGRILLLEFAGQSDSRDDLPYAAQQPARHSHRLSRMREKIGWMEDGCVSMEEAIHNFQMATFYTKWLRDMFDAQDDNGHASCIAPSPGWGKSEADGSPRCFPIHGGAAAIVRTPWQLYRYYGDRRVLEEAYPAMTRYLDYVAKYCARPHHLGPRGRLAGGGIRRPVKANASPACGHGRVLLLREDRCWNRRMLGKDDDARKYTRLAEEISSSFHRHFFDSANGLYAQDSQTAQALPLAFGMTPPEKRAWCVEQLLKNIRETHLNHVSSGIVGTLYVFQTLRESGHNDLAYAMLTREDFPSWGHMLRKRAPRRSGKPGTAAVRAIIRRWVVSTPGSTRPWEASSSTRLLPRSSISSSSPPWSAISPG